MAKNETTFYHTVPRRRPLKESPISYHKLKNLEVIPIKLGRKEVLAIKSPIGLPLNSYEPIGHGCKVPECKLFLPSNLSLGDAACAFAKHNEKEHGDLFYGGMVNLWRLKQ